jgi:hypothetical protein
MRCPEACSFTLVAVLLAGCGSAKSNEVASMTPTQILAEVQKATAGTSSVL